jgi:hypothetical protein
VTGELHPRLNCPHAPALIKKCPIAQAPQPSPSADARPGPDGHSSENLVSAHIRTGICCCKKCAPPPLRATRVGHRLAAGRGVVRKASSTAQPRHGHGQALASVRIAPPSSVSRTRRKSKRNEKVPPRGLGGLAPFFLKTEIRPMARIAPCV